MPALSFRRPSAWSSVMAIDRIEARLRQVDARLAEISAERSRLDGEAIDLDGFASQLHALLQVEVGVRDRNAVSITDPSPEQLVAEKVGGSGAPSAFHLDAAVTHSGKRSYHREGRFFSPKGVRRTGSTEPRRYDVSQNRCDPESRRLMKMIEDPDLNQHAPTRSAPVHPAEAVSVP